MNPRRASDVIRGCALSQSLLLLGTAALKHLLVEVTLEHGAVLGHVGLDSKLAVRAATQLAQKLAVAQPLLTWLQLLYTSHCPVSTACNQAQHHVAHIDVDALRVPIENPNLIY